MKYGNGISLAKSFMLDKERIKHAFNGELVCGENEDGFTYIHANKEMCDKFILECFENAVHMALTANASARALERIAGGAGKINIPLMAKYLAEEEAKDTEYQYEVEE